MMQHLSPRETGTLIQSVQRAVALLKAFDTGSPELGVSELARRVQLHKSTVSRLLATLEREGLVERADGAEKYRLGIEILRLAGRVTHFHDIRGIARPLLGELAETTRETVILAVPDGDEIINVEQLAGRHLVSESNWVGRRTPLHCVANGKALLAFRPAADIERIAHGSLRQFTSQTITEPIRLIADLATTRERGYATASGEIEEGLNSVAAPIFDGAGVVVAAVSVSGPAYRVPVERMGELAGSVVATAQQISVRLAHFE